MGTGPEYYGMLLEGAVVVEEVVKLAYEKLLVVYEDFYIVFSHLSLHSFNISRISHHRL